VLIETVLLRRRAAAKFTDPSAWLFTDEALQQSTAEPVAAHRARRLAGATVHDVTCSVGAELAALRAQASYVVGSDLDSAETAELFALAKSAFAREVEADLALRERANESARRTLRALFFPLGFTEVDFVDSLPQAAVQ